MTPILIAGLVSGLLLVFGLGLWVGMCIRAERIVDARLERALSPDAVPATVAARLAARVAARRRTRPTNATHEESR